MSHVVPVPGYHYDGPVVKFIHDPKLPGHLGGKIAKIKKPASSV